MLVRMVSVIGGLGFRDVSRVGVFGLKWSSKGWFKVAPLF